MNIRELTPKQKRWLIGGGVAVIVLCLAGTALLYLKQTSQPVDCKDFCTPITPRPVSKNGDLPPTATPSTKTAALLSGIMVEPGLENIHPLAVMIENHPEARPQSGLGQADLVYEAIAEGGITRFMAVYGNPRESIKVGPVRSARTYFVDYATELNAFYAHVGGSVPALAQIKRTGVLDLDQSAVGAAAYAREPKAGIATEHTMYSSTKKLWDYAINVKRWSQTADYKPWIFQDDLDTSKRPASQKVSVSVSSAQYDVVWDYDPAGNGYNRAMAGSIHKDANTGKQITTKNIVLQTVDRRSVTEGGKTVWEYTTSGTGSATIIHNGGVIKGSWKKTSGERTRYYDAEGKEINFLRGTTWVHLVHNDSKVSY